MLYRPGNKAMAWRAASRPTPVRRRARTTKKSLIEVPPVAPPAVLARSPRSSGAVMTKPLTRPAAVMSQAPVLRVGPGQEQVHKRVIGHKHRTRPKAARSLASQKPQPSHPTQTHQSRAPPL